MKKFNFNAIPSGDYEAFTFAVTKEDYIKLIGKEPEKVNKNKFHKNRYDVYFEDLIGYATKEFNFDISIKDIQQETKKVAINKCHGGFQLNVLACIDLVKRKHKDKEIFLYTSRNSCDEEIYSKVDTNCIDIDGLNWSSYITFEDLGEEIDYCTMNNYNDKIFALSYSDIDREDPDLIALIEEYDKDNKNIGRRYSNIQIIEIPKDVKYEIKNYDGYEWIAECHRTWE